MLSTELGNEDAKSHSTDVTPCSVMLTDVCRTRARSSSSLTVDNLAVHNLSARRSQRSTRASSVLSEDVAISTPVKRGRITRASSILSEDVVATSPARRGKSTRASSVLSEESSIDSPIENGKTPKKDSTTPYKRRQSLRSKTLKEGINETINEVEESIIPEDTKSVDIDNGEGKNGSSNGIDDIQSTGENKSIETDELSVTVKTPLKSKFNIRDEVIPKKVPSPLQKTAELINESNLSKASKKSPTTVKPVEIELIEVIERNVSASANVKLDQSKTTQSNEVEKIIDISDDVDEEDQKEDSNASTSSDNKQSELNSVEIEATPPLRKSVTPRKLFTKTSIVSPEVSSSAVKTVKDKDVNAIEMELTSEIVKKDETMNIVDDTVEMELTPAIVEKDEPSNMVTSNLDKSLEQKTIDTCLDKSIEQVRMQNDSNENDKPTAKQVRIEGVETPKSKSNGTYISTPFPRKTPRSMEGNL